MFIAMVSLLTGKPVRSDVAMTARSRCVADPAGGGIKRNSWLRTCGYQARRHAGAQPQDIIDIPEQPRKEIEIIFVKRMDELLPFVLTEMPKLQGTMSSAVTRHRRRHPAGTAFGVVLESEQGRVAFRRGCANVAV